MKNYILTLDNQKSFINVIDITNKELDIKKIIEFYKNIMSTIPPTLHYEITMTEPQSQQLNHLNHPLYPQASPQELFVCFGNPIPSN